MTPGTAQAGRITGGLSEYPTRFEMQTAVQSVADPVIVLTEAEFAAIVPDATKIYVIY